MAVFRVERNTGYTVMSNHHLRNKELSLKAKGLLSQMLSLPEDWDYTLSGLSYINRESIDAIRTAVWELEKAGYKGDFSHDRCRKETVAGTAPIGGSAGAGPCQEAKSEDAQAHSGRRDSGKGAAGGADDGAVCAGGLPDAEAAAARLNQHGGLQENGDLLLFSPVRAHLLTTCEAGGGIAFGNRALCEADAAPAGALCPMPHHICAAVIGHAVG